MQNITFEDRLAAEEIELEQVAESVLRSLGPYGEVKPISAVHAEVSYRFYKAGKSHQESEALAWRALAIHYRHCSLPL
jgi:hypothetical protein